MPMRIDDKKVAVKELNEIANKAISAVAADYHGTSVSELTKLREEARNSSIHLKIIRNTLAKRALTDTKFSCFDELLVGPTILAFSLDDPASAAKLANNFNKVNSNFNVKGLSMGETLLELSRLNDIANLPTKEESLTKMVVMLNQPVTKFASALNNSFAKLLSALGNLKETKN